MSKLVQVMKILFFMCLCREMMTNSPLPVNLGTAANYVILSKAGISTTGVTAITGDIAVSPITSTAITGFSLIADSTNTFSTSTVFSGKAFASDYLEDTPALLTTAVGDLGTAYTDASGRNPNTDLTDPAEIQVYNELGEGEIGGQVLTPGVYKWSTGVTASNDVTISGSSTDQWIFITAKDLLFASGAKVTLQNGALAQNIVWAVTGAVTLNTTAHLKGTVLCATKIVCMTGSRVNGRLLAQTAVTLDATTITP